MIRLVKNQGAVDLSKKMMKGDPGGHYIPEVDIEGNLSWVASEEDMPAVEGANIRGVQGEPGKDTVWVGDEAPTDEYYNVWIAPAGEATDDLLTRQDMTQYVDEKIEAIPEPDLSAYALKEEIPSTAGLATEQYVDEAIGGIPEPDLSNYYNKDEIDAALENVDVDLTGYATEKYVNDAIEAIEIPDNTPIATVDVAGKVKPDGTTITITEDGTISSVATGGGGSVEVDGKTIVNNDGVISLAYPMVEGKVAIGTGAQTTNNHSLAVGFGAKAKANSSLAVGENTEASGYSSFAAGNMAITGGKNSIALGYQASTNKENSVAIGHFAKSHSADQVVLGYYNEFDSQDKYRFIIGNGQPNDYGNTTSANGMTISKDNTVVWFAGDVYVGGKGQDDENALMLATRKYVDEVATGTADMDTFASKAYVDAAIAAIVDGDEVSY